MSVATEIERIKSAKESIINTLKANDIQIEENATIDEVDIVMNDVPILDTTDATATAEDIAEGKTAYVNGEKIVGNMGASENNAKIKTVLQAGTSSSPTIRNIITEINADITIDGNSASYLCAGAKSLEIVKSIDTSNVVNISNMFSNCSGLKKLSSLDGSKFTNIMDAFKNCSSLSDFGGILNLGKAYTYKENENSYYSLQMGTCTSLTHDSVINIFNGLYDLNLTYDVANGGKLYWQTVVLPQSIKELFTEEELAIVDNKGWRLLWNTLA